jgi:type III pantothenate kinase
MRKAAVFDVGNTSLKFALAANGRAGKAVVIDNSVASVARLTQALESVARERGLCGALACSVAPAGARRLSEAWRRLSSVPLQFLHCKMRMPIELEYPRPASIGADRLAVASASYRRVKGAHIVIDAGTAVTVDCVDGKGHFIGGAIAPGPAVMTGYLSSTTGLLPKMDYAGPVPAVGRSTRGAMKIGVRVGYGAMLRAIVQHMREGAFGGARIPLVVSGGYARQAARELGEKCIVVEGLALEGLALIYELNV